MMSNETKWTPGAWHVERYKEPYTSSLDTYIVVSSAGLIVAKCGTGDFEMPDNANLIAAAPELYEALKLADAEFSGANIDILALERKIHAALAKARGEHS